LAGTQNIVDLTYLNTERLGKRTTERKAIYDLYCENEKGEKFIVELQRAKQESPLFISPHLGDKGGWVNGIIIGKRFIS